LSIEDSPQQAAENLRSVRGTNHPLFARLPRGKPRGMRSRADSISHPFLTESADIGTNV
jgi:hypothetical protein